MSQIIYIELQDAIDKHDMAINKSGGLLGISCQNQGRLAGILDFVKNDDYYPTFTDKLCYLTYAIAKDHLFLDGNKRGAMAIGAYFMALNSYEETIGQYWSEMENYIVWAMENRIPRMLFNQKIAYIISGDPEPDDFKLEVIHLLEK